MSLQGFTLMLTELSNDELSRIFLFLDYKELCHTLPLTHSIFNKLLKFNYPYWIICCEKACKKLCINWKELYHPERTHKEYRKRFLHMIPLLKQRKELKSTLTALQYETEIYDNELYDRIKTILLHNLKLVIGFEGKEERDMWGESSRKSRFAANVYGIPYGSNISADDMVLQLDMSLLENTISSQLYNLPETGYLYYKYDGITPTCFYYEDYDLREREAFHEVNIGFGENFVIDKAVEMLELPAIEEIPELEEIFGRTESYDLIYLHEGLKDLSFFKRKGLNRCNLQMFGAPYYVQRKSEFDHDDSQLLFQYYTSGGLDLCYIAVDKSNLIRGIDKYQYLQYHYQN
jgi:hypothetical protein